jgi:hypothetical protein
MQKRRLRRRVARIRSTMKVSQFGKQCRISICSSRAKTKAETWKITKLHIFEFSAPKSFRFIEWIVWILKIWKHQYQRKNVLEFPGTKDQ